MLSNALKMGNSLTLAIDPLVPKYRERYAKRAATAQVSGQARPEMRTTIVLPPYYGGVKRTRDGADDDLDDGDDDEYEDYPGTGKRSRNSY